MKLTRKCKACNMDKPPTKRKIKKLKDNIFGEYWWVSNFDNKFCLSIEYDCGYAITCIEGIKYCPKCGRKLNENKS